MSPYIFTICRLFLCSFLLQHAFLAEGSGQETSTLQKNVHEDLLAVDTLESDSLKLFTLLALAGRKYRYAPKSRILLDKCHEIATRSGDSLFIGNYYYALGNYLYYNSHLDSSSHYLQKAFSINQVKTEPFLHSQILTTISGIKNKQGQVIQALQTQLEAKRIIENIDTGGLSDRHKIRRLGQISVLDNGIGNLYHSIEDYELAIDHYTEAYDVLIGLGDLRSAGTVMGNIGEMHLYTFDYDQALQALNKALRHKEDGDSPARSRALTLFNIGRALKHMGHPDTALAEFNTAISIFEQENYLNGLMEGFIERGILHLESGEYDLARKDCEKGLDLAIGQSHVKSRSKACECLYRVHKLAGNDRTALKYHEQYVTLKDSLFNADNIKKLTRMEMEYNFDRER